VVVSRQMMNVYL